MSIIVIIIQLKLLYTHFPVPTPFSGVTLTLPSGTLWVLRSLGSAWCLWGCYGETSASGVFCQEYDVDGFFFFTLGSPRASSLCFLIHFFILLCLHRSASPCYIQIYYMWCVLHKLDTCSFFSCYPPKLVLSSSWSAFL